MATGGSWGGPSGGWGSPPTGGYAPGPYAPPPGMPPGHQPRSPGAPMAGGVPWESEDAGFLRRWWDTITAANFRGRQLFAAVAQGDDPLAAALFSTLTHLLAALGLVLLWGVVMVIFFTAFVAFAGSVGGPRAAAAMAGMGTAIFALYGLGFVFVMGLAGFIGPWLVGGLHHLVLLVVGGVGEGRGFTDTVRVAAYGGAAALLFVPIPFFGGMVSLVFNAINHVTGYDVVHGCGGGKAFLAWVSPVLVSCCCNCFFMGLVGSIG